MCGRAEIAIAADYNVFVQIFPVARRDQWTIIVSVPPAPTGRTGPGRGSRKRVRNR